MTSMRTILLQQWTNTSGFKFVDDYELAMKAYHISPTHITLLNNDTRSRKYPEVVS